MTDEQLPHDVENELYDFNRDMERRRTRQEGIRFYAPVKAKAAKDCKETLRDLKAWFPNNEISFKLGYYGESDKLELKHREHEKGEPDIFVYWKDAVCCAVEVTGSDKVRMPALVWIGKHKMDYAQAAKFPVGYALYYLGSRWFVPAGRVKQESGEAETKKIGGYSEYYHVLEPKHLDHYDELREWVKVQIIGFIFSKGEGIISQVDGLSNSFAGDPSPF